MSCLFLFLPSCYRPIFCKHRMLRISLHYLCCAVCCPNRESTCVASVVKHDEESRNSRVLFPLLSLSSQSTMLVRSARASTPVAGRRHAASSALDRRSLDVYARARQDQLQGDNSSAPISRSGPAKRGKVPRADVALPEELDKTVTGIINGEEDAVADSLPSLPSRLEPDLLLGRDQGWTTSEQYTTVQSSSTGACGIRAVHRRPTLARSACISMFRLRSLTSPESCPPCTLPP